MVTTLCERPYFWLTVAYSALLLISGARAETQTDINAKVGQLEIGKSTLDDVIRVFGQPTDYVWGNQTFTRDDLPETYIARYPEGPLVVIIAGRVGEFRFHRPGYRFHDKIQVGSSLDEVLKVVGPPAKTVQEKPDRFVDGVLYRDMDGRKGYCYYARSDHGVRFFFMDNRVNALYLTGLRSQAGGGISRTVRPIAHVKRYDDVRWKDMSGLDLSRQPGLPTTLTFNEKTVWPGPAKMPSGVLPKQLLTSGMNPGLGVRSLHKDGITGKGVSVGIIDQPMYQDHPEFAGKIAAYKDTGCGSESSMHGPAVTSLLVGAKCGTAPDARVYYVAAPSWNKDSAYYAKGLNSLVEQNKALPVANKIRVVSVSAAPSGRGSPFEKNTQEWDKACSRAEKAGILVLDCTRHHGFIGPCWYDAAHPEDVAKCTPGFPGQSSSTLAGYILVPSSPRTTAEQYLKEEYGYQYCGRGGLSWSIPYAAGVLALGWQVAPDTSPQRIREMLFQSAHTTKDGAKIIDPRAFIELVKTQR